MDNSQKTPNSLIHETSPYLLQHAYNPVHWLPFSEKAFETAKAESKMVLVSIGYSACHWCHVMEHESFEDAEVAELMNRHFVNIKVDREERSDVDMLYMQAVQLMTGRGGWPLNCFVLPNGKPFYGGTYFTKAQWLNVLRNLSESHKNDPEKVKSYSEELAKGIQQSELITTQEKSNLEVNRNTIDQSVNKWKKSFDTEEGGPNRAPKFPLPSNYQFLLRYALLKNDQEVLDHVYLTLNKMAFGGIYDQLHGGFSRYSTDMIWKVPHFEKMLYDNAQLLSLYCEAYQHSKNNLYKQIVTDTLSFVEQDWLGPEGQFYSAYDADSDGEEGKYYVWNEIDLKELLNEDYELFSKYFEINSRGYWEHGNYILMRSENTAQVLGDFNLTREELDKKIRHCKEILKQEGKSRLKPGLDDKSLTSWNAMMCTAYCKAYLSFGDEKHKTLALRSIQFILKHLSAKEGGLYRTFKNGTSKIDGFLEDYAFCIEALINCYLVSVDEQYLNKAKELCELSLKMFHNPKSPFLYYTNNTSNTLMTRITEISDNVIPASNSQMALNLFYLSKYFNKQDWALRAGKMLNSLSEEFVSYGSGYSNWGCLALHLTYPFNEVAIVGKDVNEKFSVLYKQGITNAIFALSGQSSDLPLLKNRALADKTPIYVCRNSTCLLPVETIEAALKQIETV